MNNLVAIDIGNTNISVGIFISGRLAQKVKIPTNCYCLYEKGFVGIFKRSGLSLREEQQVIVSSVVPIALARLMMHLNKIARCRISIVGRDVHVPIKNMYRIKSEVGQDRLVNAYAAMVIYGKPAVIIDFGTAITFDVVSKKGEYLGGLILPGIGMSLAGLHEKTALLPRVELKESKNIIGIDTVNSMRGGILFGFGSMCDGLTAKYRKILGPNMKVIATGGNSALIKRYAECIDFLDEDITLKGLHLLATR